MRKKLLLSQVSLFILLLILLVSCNNTGSDAAKTDMPDSTGTMAPDAMPPQLNLLAGNLDTLWIEAADFAALNQRLTFRFFATSNSFTLHGWLGNNFNNKPPDVKLLTGRQSTVQYAAGSYFGNLQLSPSDMNKIQQILTNTNSKYVVFGPANPTIGPDAGEIIYNVFVTKDDPGNLTPGFMHKFLVDPTGIETNPSPPKNSY